MLSRCIVNRPFLLEGCVGINKIKSAIVVGENLLHIHEFQKMMRTLYFHRDSARGVIGTFNWLKEEVEELEDALDKEDRRELENEFADVIAWLTSLANIMNIDLEQAALQKYPSICPKCEKSPCECTF